MDKANNDIIYQPFPDNKCLIYHIPDQSLAILPQQFDAFHHPKIQYFSFPDTTINYLLATSSLKIYQKFLKTCKYFYAVKQIAIIPNLELQYLLKFVGYPYSGPDTRLKLYSNQISKIWITDSLESAYESDENGLSKFCSKIYKCQARSIEIRHQNLTEKEFNFLIKSEFVIIMRIGKTLIKKVNGNFRVVEEVFEHLPKCHFFRKNARPNAEFSIYLNFTSDGLLENDKEEIEDFVNTWNPQIQKPTIMLNKIINFHSLHWNGNMCM